MLQRNWNFYPFFGWLWIGTKTRLVNAGVTQDGEFLDQLKEILVTFCVETAFYDRVLKEI
jgi:hypothetical protein